jgi:hypothetical protein
MAKKITRLSFPDLQRALDQESYEWLSANVPEVVKSLEAEIANGADDPHVLRVWIIQNYRREEIAARIEQAARHILSGKSA